MFNRRQLLIGSGAALMMPPRGLLELGHNNYGRLAGNTLAETDPRNWTTGTVMWDGGYSDQPYVVTMPDGSLVSTLTVSNSVEGAGTQQVVILRSDDNGATWATIAEMEPASAPESSWGMPWLHQPSQRLYVLYTYNVDDIRSIPNNDGTGTAETRVDTIGVLAYRSSIDGGYTWSDRRIVDVPVSDIDLRNPYRGQRRLFWSTGHIVQHGGVAYLGMSKMGRADNGFLFGDTEAFVATIWETAPGVLDGDLSAPIRLAGPVNEEPSPLVFDDTVNAVFRTATGWLGEAWSADGGATWLVDWARDQAGSAILQPRAKAAQFRLPDGRLFLWGHNAAAAPGAWGPRNPVFYRLGERDGPRIVWGPATLLLHGDDPATGFSYPSLTVVGDELLIAATDKATARMFRFPLV